MTNIVDSIGTLASQNYLLAFFTIYVLTIFLGNISAFASFWIIFRGYLGPWGVPLLVVTLFASDMTGDMLWFSLGRETRHTKFGQWIHRHLPGRERLERALKHNGRKWIVLSKFMYAAAFPVTFSAGWVGMDLWRFIRISLLSVAIWIPVLLGLTYGLVSGLSPLAAVSIFRDFEVLFFVGLGVFLILDFLFTKVLAKVLGKEDDLVS